MTNTYIVTANTYDMATEHLLIQLDADRNLYLLVSKLLIVFCLLKNAGYHEIMEHLASVHLTHEKRDISVDLTGK